ncbi:SPFH domain-containing protein [Mucilaginibacter paludis]|uniref:Transmembrane protein n=1 Tax=Mucilaginibacter paludis DSM 18603 TaxID=714943 RepID=H1YBI2_9SPHI|nr:SPFH domain-containing protein [Mucilaginibacter paludis]EHQ25053.1 transmembrane protein [Mucilaginibacter paludis DSM 18603]
MGIVNATKNQFRSVIQWDDPKEWELFRKFDIRGDELKNISKLILQPGQGCIYTYEGTVKGLFNEPGIYDIQTDNRPFITTLKKFINFFESEHKTGIWFYRTADIVNMRWGTRLPVTYVDPFYTFPVNLRAYGNFSIRITQPEAFFTRIVAGQSNYDAYNLQELLLSRISQKLGQYLANAKFSYAEVDSNLEKMASDATAQTQAEFADFGFELLDFRIEGSSFDQETNNRIAGISNIQADAKAAQLAGLTFEEMQKMMALREAVRNENGLGAGVVTVLNLTNTPLANPADLTLIRAKLIDLKELYDSGLIDDNEFKMQKAKILKQF